MNINKYGGFSSVGIFFYALECFIFIIIFFSFGSCKKFVEVPPPNTSVTGSNVYTDDVTAIAVFTSVYKDMSSGGFATGSRSISISAALSADELSVIQNPINANALLFFRNSLVNSQNLTFWESLYKVILTVNSAIEGITSSSSLTTEVKNQLLGEAKFIRSFIYFYLVNFYGKVPLAITSNYETNALLGRSSEEEVYQQIISDLKEAKELLSDKYLNLSLLSETDERIRPNKWAAIALLSRVYLYTKEWEKAEIESTLIIENNSKFDTVPLANVFLKNNKEAIWQLQPVNVGWNTEDARSLFMPNTGPNSFYPYFLNNNLISDFDSLDQRKNIWAGSVKSGGMIYYYPYKYKSATLNSSVTEYSTVLRLAEQYLIRAEARANQNNLLGSLYDLNIIKLRARLPVSSLMDKVALLDEIIKEKRIELFTEWGHRWLDLKRIDMLNSVMQIVTPQKGGKWSSDWRLYPLPLYDLQLNPNLEQNQGY